MTALPRPDVIITHESDLDGLLAGVLLQRLAKKLFGDDVRLEAYHYNFWKQREPREKAAWVTDLTFEARLDKQNWAVIDMRTNRPITGSLSASRCLNVFTAVCRQRSSSTRTTAPTANPSDWPQIWSTSETAKTAFDDAGSWAI